MARFRYEGELAPPPGLVARMGDCIEIRVPVKAGGKQRLVPGAGGKFVAGQSVIEVTDERAIRHLRSDPRFKEVGVPP